MTSRYYSEQELKGLNKIGNIYFPKTQQLPSFTQAGCVKNIDRILEFMPEGDRNDLKMLLGIFALTPSLLIRMIFFLLEFSPRLSRFFPGGSLLRFIRIGVRGLLMSLYYGDEDILHKLEYKVDVYTQDLKN